MLTRKIAEDGLCKLWLLDPLLVSFPTCGLCSQTKANIPLKGSPLPWPAKQDVIDNALGPEQGSHSLHRTWGPCREPDQKLLHAKGTPAHSPGGMLRSSPAPKSEIWSVLMSSPQPLPLVTVPFLPGTFPTHQPALNCGENSPACIQLNFIEILISFCFFIESPCGLLLLTSVLCFWNWLMLSHTAVGLLHSKYSPWINVSIP